MTYAKKMIVPVLCVLLGCAGGAAMGNATAQTWPENPSAQRWQQECVEPPTGRAAANVRFYQDEIRIRGEHGWEFVGEFYGMPCFKRPAP